MSVLLVPSENNVEISNFISDILRTTVGLLFWMRWDRNPNELLYHKAYEKETLLPCVPRSFGKRQALVCRSSAMPYHHGLRERRHVCLVVRWCFLLWCSNSLLRFKIQDRLLFLGGRGRELVSAGLLCASWFTHCLISSSVPLCEMDGIISFL